jgi:hypothetical protein
MIGGMQMLRWFVTLGLSASLGFAASMLVYPQVSGAQSGGDVFASQECGFPGHPVDMQRLYAAVGNYPHGQLVFVNRAEKQQLIANLRNQPRTMGQPMWELAPCYGCTQERDACIIYWVRYWGPTAGDLYGSNDQGPKVPPRVPPTGGGDVFSSDCRKNPQSYTCLYGRPGIPPGRPEPNYQAPAPKKCVEGNWVDMFFLGGRYWINDNVRMFNPDAANVLDTDKKVRPIDPKMAPFAPGVRTAEACHDNGCFPSAIAQDRRWETGIAYIARTARNPMTKDAVGPNKKWELLLQTYGRDDVLSEPGFNQNRIRQMEETARQQLRASGIFSRGFLAWNHPGSDSGHIVNWRLMPRPQDIRDCLDKETIIANSRIEFWDASLGTPAVINPRKMETVVLFYTVGSPFFIPQRRLRGR